MRRLASLFGVCLFVLALAAAPSTASAAPVLYAVTFGNQLITINTATGAGTLVGNLDSSMGALGLGVLNGKLYTYDQTANRLTQLSTVNADTLNAIDLGLVLVGEGGLDFRSDGTGYLNSTAGANSSLYSFTEAAGSGVLVGNTGGVAGLDGLAFSSTDVLFGLGQQPNNNLYTVNQSTAALTLIGATGIVGNNSLGGLDFLGAILYGVINDSLYTLNTATGVATLIGGVGFTGVSGLAFIDADQQAVPEPASLVLIGTGLFALASRRRRQV